MINREDESEDFIKVIGNGYDYAFSRGLIAHNLGLRGLPLEEAYVVAMNVHVQLIADDIKEINENDLRRVVRTAALAFAGSDVAYQYDLIEKWHMSAIPLVILIAGSKGTDTDVIGTLLAEKLGIPRIVSTSMVTQILRKMISPELSPELHQKSSKAYNKLRPIYSVLYDKVLIGFEEHSRYPAEAVEALVRRALVEGISMVIHGEHLPPRFLSEFLVNHPTVVYVTLRSKKTEKHKARYLKRYSPKTHAKKEKEFEDVRKIHDYLVEEAKSRGNTVIKMDRTNKALTKIYTIVLDQLSSMIASKTFKEYKSSDPRIIHS